jgi:NitT/TauT family transport system permease protein
MTSVALAETQIADAARHRRRRRTTLVWLARALALLIILGGWELFTDLKIVDPFFYGQPSGIYRELVHWAKHGTAFGSIWLQIWVTLKEALLGFVFGVSTGIVLGVLLGQIRFLAEVLGPYIKIINALPRIVLGSIFFVAFGFGTTSKVLLASVLVFFVVFFNAFQGVREVDRNLVANARVLGASRWQVVRNVVLPSALVWIIASLHVAFGFSIIGAIVGEFLGAQKGLGLVISNSQNNFNPDGVFAAMVIIGVVALSAEALIAQLEHRLLAWRPPAPTEAGSI